MVYINNNLSVQNAYGVYSFSLNIQIFAGSVEKIAAVFDSGVSINRAAK